MDCTLHYFLFFLVYLPSHRVLPSIYGLPGPYGPLCLGVSPSHCYLPLMDYPAPTARCALVRLPLISDFPLWTGWPIQPAGLCTHTLVLYVFVLTPIHTL